MKALTTRQTRAVTAALRLGEKPTMDGAHIMIAGMCIATLGPLGDPYATDKVEDAVEFRFSSVMSGFVSWEYKVANALMHLYWNSRDTGEPLDDDQYAWREDMRDTLVTLNREHPRSEAAV